MKRTTGIRMTVWLGILAVCLAVLMPGVNALRNSYQASENDIFTADVCYGAQAELAPVVAVNSSAPPVLQFSASHHSVQANLDASAVNQGAVHTTHATHATHAAHDGASALSALVAGSDAPGSSGHSADHAAECLYCGFFTQHLPLLYSANLPAMSYGFVSRIAPQHQHASYYAQPAFVPLSRAPPSLS